MASASQPITGPLPPLRAAISARVSSIEQDAEGKTSIAEQVARCRAEIDRRGWTLDERHVFVDRVSGKLTSRFERPLAAARAGQIDALVFTKVDRLARSLRDMLNLEAELSDLGVVLVATDLPLDTTTPAGRLVFQQWGAIAEYEAANIVERMTLANRASVKRGGWPGGELPWGLALVDGAVVPNPTEVEVIRTAYDLVVHQGLSCWQAADELNRFGSAATPRGRVEQPAAEGSAPESHPQGPDAVGSTPGPAARTASRPRPAQQDLHRQIRTPDLRGDPGCPVGGRVAGASGRPGQDIHHAPHPRGDCLPAVRPGERPNRDPVRWAHDRVLPLRPGPPAVPVHQRPDRGWPESLYVQADLG